MTLRTRLGRSGVRYPPGFLSIRMNSMSFFITEFGSYGFAPHVGGALAGQVAAVGIAGVETHRGSVNRGHLAEERRKRARLALPFGKVDLGGRQFVAGSDGLFLAEIVGLVGASAVLQRSAFLRQILDGLLVHGVGGQPELAPQFLVVVFHG